MTNFHVDDRPWYERAHSGMARVRAQMGEKLAALVLETCGPYLAKPVSQLDVLDCGCGYGQTAIALASRCRYVLGIEPCQSMYDQAVALAQQAQRRNLGFENCSIHRFTKTGCFDLAILDNVLEHISDQHDALARLYQALRTNGLLLYPTNYGRSKFIMGFLFCRICRSLWQIYICELRGAERIIRTHALHQPIGE